MRGAGEAGLPGGGVIRPDTQGVPSAIPRLSRLISPTQNGTVLREEVRPIAFDGEASERITNRVVDRVRIFLQ